MRRMIKRTVAFVAALSMSCVNFIGGTTLLNRVYAEDTEEMPSKFDLRDYGYVTPVKFQNPWGACWGFSSIAAAETSILGELGLTYTEFKEIYGIDMDLSEKHLAYFAATPMPEGSSQAGEGIYVIDESMSLDIGGTLINTASLFSSGIGPYFEFQFPYHGKNETTQYYYYDADGKAIASSLLPDDPSIEGYAKVEPFCYARADDWTIDEDYRFGAGFVLQESNILQSPANSDGSLNVEALNKMKQELLNKKAIAIQFYSSETGYDSLGNLSQYYNSETGASYVSDLNTGVSHGVTIVGYDDNYPKENFAITPPGDGAFIVKNSWGSAENEFPHKYGWGYNKTGYFYLSYYDNSISQPETYDFDVERIKVSIPTYIIDQYDLMPGSYDMSAVGYDNKVSFTNVFVADCDEIVNQASLVVPVPSAEVEIEVYSLGSSYDSVIDGELVYSTSKNFENAGYHSIKFDKSIFVAEGDSYSIVATVKGADNKYYMSFRTNVSKGGHEYLESVNPKYHMVSYSVGVVGKGESYVISDNGIEDFTDVAPLILGENTAVLSYDNFTLKGYAVPNSGKIGDDVDYVIDKDGVLSITGSGSTYEYDDKNLAPWYLVCDSIKEIKVEKDVKIAEGLFIGLEDIEIQYEKDESEKGDIGAGDNEADAIVITLALCCGCIILTTKKKVLG